MMNILKQLRLFRKFYLNSGSVNGPEKHTEFAMYLEKVDLEQYDKTLRKSAFNYKTIATINYDDKNFPVSQLDWGDPTASKRLLVLAGVHGNEIAGMLAIPDILKDIEKNATHYIDWCIRIVTPVNPVGVTYQSRYDQDGRDLNRDFKEFSSIGARLQRDVIEDFKPTIVVTLHESPDEGFYMFSEGRLPRQVKTAIADTLVAESIPLAKKNFLHIKLQSGLWEKPPIIYMIQRQLGIYTLGRYLYEKKISTITTESTWSGKDMSARKRPHALVIRAILES